MNELIVDPQKIKLNASTLEIAAITTQTKNTIERVLLKPNNFISVEPSFWACSST